MVAIKLIKDPFVNDYTARQTYREIKIMRKMLEVPFNVFTPKLIDIIVPGCSFIKSDSYTALDILSQNLPKRESPKQDEHSEPGNIDLINQNLIS